MKSIYEICVGQLNEDNNRFWTVFYVFTAVNGGLLAFVASARVNSAFKCTISLIAAIICILWYLIQARLEYWSKKWEEKIEEVEQLYSAESKNENEFRDKVWVFPANLKIYRDRKSEKKSSEHWPGMSTYLAGKIIPWLFMFAWILIFMITLCQNL